MAVLPLNQVFTARAIGMNWDNYKATLGEPPYLGRQKFGTRKQQGLDLRFIKGANGLPVSLKASNFDAQAPLRDGIGFSDIQCGGIRCAGNPSGSSCFPILEDWLGCASRKELQD